MDYTYTASRVTSGNIIFRDKITIYPKRRIVKIYKRNKLGIGQDQVIVSISDIASVRIITRKEWFYFCTILIETKGGRLLDSNGFTLKDAKKIKNLIYN